MFVWRAIKCVFWCAFVMASAEDTMKGSFNLKKKVSRFALRRKFGASRRLTDSAPIPVARRPVGRARGRPADRPTSRPGARTPCSWRLRSRRSRKTRPARWKPRRRAGRWRCRPSTPRTWRCARFPISRHRRRHAEGGDVLATTFPLFSSPWLSSIARAPRARSSVRPPGRTTT